MRKVRNTRRESQFEQWLAERRYRDNQTFEAFRNRCDAGEIEGQEIYEDPKEKQEDAEGDG